MFAFSVKLNAVAAKDSGDALVKKVYEALLH